MLLVVEGHVFWDFECFGFRERGGAMARVLTVTVVGYTTSSRDL